MFQPVSENTARFNLNLAVVLDVNDEQQQRQLRSVKSLFKMLSHRLHIDVTCTPLKEIIELAFSDEWSGVLILKDCQGIENNHTKLNTKRYDLIPVLGLSKGIMAVNKLMSASVSSTLNLTTLGIKPEQQSQYFQVQPKEVSDRESSNHPENKEPVFLQRPGRLCRWFSGHQSIDVSMTARVSEQEVAAICQVEAVDLDGEISAISGPSSLGYIVGVGWTLSAGNSETISTLDRHHEFQLLKTFAVACRNFGARKNYIRNTA